ncbi:uncharacterized protein LOC34617627 [Cyclospora cayetanensis]|uniref:Uncharacterized protein LOC34617627 n=1 Tax=Cyclospora cayetanensis TaxID=88456 RepID=A0A6P6RVH2_9EIME|nr:uncharacterized protein LOC34617627 [Cyclospora cayetanensis]
MKEEIHDVISTSNASAAAAAAGLSQLTVDDADASRNIYAGATDSAELESFSQKEDKLHPAAQDEASESSARGRGHTAVVTAGEPTEVLRVGNLRGGGAMLDKAAAAEAAKGAAAAAAQAVSAAESAAVAAWGSTDISSRNTNSSASGGSPVDIRSLLFPSWSESVAPPMETQGTQLFIENDGSIRLNVHPSGSRTRRGRGRGQRVLSPDTEDFLDDDDFYAFPQQRQKVENLPETRLGAARGSNAAATVAMEELLLLERLRAAGVDPSLRSHLEEALQQQVHQIGSSAGGEAFVETTDSQTSSGLSTDSGFQGCVYPSLFLLVLDFLSLTLFSLWLAVAAFLSGCAPIDADAKKKLEAQLAALQGIPGDEAAAAEAQMQQEEGWIDVSVEKQTPQASEQIQSLAKGATKMFATPTGEHQREKKKGGEEEKVKGMKGTEKDKDKKEKGEKHDKGKKDKDKHKKDKKKEKKEGKKPDIPPGSSSENPEDEKKLSRKKKQHNKEKELMRVLSSRRTLKLP